MTLPFTLTDKTGKPNYFMDKIWEGLFRNNIIADDLIDAEYNKYIDLYEELTQRAWPDVPECHNRWEYPKEHTIRQGDRFKKGMPLHMVVHNRSKHRFQFAPTLICTRVEPIFMTYAFNDIIEITVGDKYLNFPDKEILAKRDGFDNYQAFFDYFYPVIEASPDKCFSGQIIHWTNNMYYSNL